MENVTVRQPAPDRSRFAPDAFASSIGREIPFNIEGHPVPGAACKLLAAEVTDDGDAVLLTLDVPSTIVREIQVRPEGRSFGYSIES